VVLGVIFYFSVMELSTHEFLQKIKKREKDIYIAFIENDVIKIYKHDDAYQYVKKHTKLTKSWNMEKGGGHSWGKTPEYFHRLIKEL
jgi:hypothetical protein